MSVSSTKRIAVVTGSNKGIGYQAVKLLAKQPNYHVILTARDAKLGEEAIKSLGSDSNIEFHQLDITNEKSLDEFASYLKKKFNGVDVLVNNAGIALMGRMAYSVDGYELTFATNHLGPFLLTNLLLPNLQKTPGARVVVVSSGLHDPKIGGPKVTIDFDNLQGEKQFDGFTAYKNSKLANMLFTYELHQRLLPSGVTVNALTPGFIPDTGLSLRSWGGNLFFHAIFVFLIKLMPVSRTRSVGWGGDHLVYLSTHPELNHVSGKYFVDFLQAQSSQESYDVNKAKRLWDISRGLVHLTS